MHPLSRGAALLACALSLSACDIFGSSKGPPLPGERISVLQEEQEIQPDPAAAEIPVVLPRPFSNPDWPQSGGYANFAMQHLALGDLPQVAWRVSVGSGASSSRALLAPPVMAEGKVFAKDAGNTVTAVEAGTGKVVWTTDISPKNRRDSNLFGGGVAYYAGRLFVSTGFAQVIALDAATGNEVWRSDVSGPVRGAPTVFADRVFVVTIDNQLYALSAVDGNELWNQIGVAESAGLLGGTSPAASADTVVAPFTSGELVAVRIDTGRPIWTENVITARRSDSVASLNDIKGRPVIDRGRVFAIGNGGIMVAVDLRSGGRVWDKPFGGLQTPWVAGEFVFTVTTSNEVVAVTREQGRVKWVTPLDRFGDPKAKRDPIYWAGPVLAGDRLLLAGSTGELLSLSPYDGRILGRLVIGAPVNLAPIVANGTVYLLTDNADLIALR